mmetsp:Transcript_32563/g.82312  ORF Transcript_32563/g.82312 Transcript_32563/m.82312 type:complete len:231 (-) Transcript_32563:186-878(-)
MSGGDGLTCIALHTTLPGRLNTTESNDALSSTVRLPWPANDVSICKPGEHKSLEHQHARDLCHETLQRTESMLLLGVRRCLREMREAIFRGVTSASWPSSGPTWRPMTKPGRRSSSPEGDTASAHRRLSHEWGSTAWSILSPNAWRKGASDRARMHPPRHRRQPLRRQPAARPNHPRHQRPCRRPRLARWCYRHCRTPPWYSLRRGAPCALLPCCQGLGNSPARSQREPR